MQVHQFPDRTITINGKEYLYFGGTSYLGLATNPKFQKRLIDAIKQWGTAYGSSRAANIQLDIYAKAEAYFADKFEAEKAVSVSSGTLAGRLVIEYLQKVTDQFFHYPKTHPAILHPSSQQLFQDGKINSKLQSGSKENVVIMVDAVLASEVSPTNFGFLDEVSSSKYVTLIVDESHSIGLCGRHGWGIFSKIQHRNISRKIMTASLSKALGCVGGIIASDTELIEDLMREPLFIGSSAMNPAYLECIMGSEDLIKDKQSQLKKNVHFLHDSLIFNEKIKFDKNYPVLYLEGSKLFDLFLNEAIIISSFNYPSYRGVMNRIVITANHTEDDLMRLAKVFNLL